MTCHRRQLLSLGLAVAAPLKACGGDDTAGIPAVLPMVDY
jgi:hypothetical protein